MDYIGQTKNGTIKRIKSHIVTDSLIGEAIREHEIKNFKLEFIWEAINQKEADIVERAAIFVYNTKIPNGYNITSGGRGENYSSGWYHTEEAKKKMRENHADFNEDKNPNYGNGIKVTGDKNPKWIPREIRTCACGCKQTFECRKNSGHKFINGHNSKGRNNPSHRIDVKIKKLKTRIRKLEK